MKRGQQRLLRKIFLAKEGKMGKARDPGVGNKISATVIGSQGTNAEFYVLGDQFELSVHNPDGLCGFFYLTKGHAIWREDLGGLKIKLFLRRSVLY